MDFVFFLGIALIVTFWKDETTRLAGFYSIKPFVLHFIGYDFVKPWFARNYQFMILGGNSIIVGVISYLILEIILSSAIIYFFRGLLLSRLQLPRLLFLLDISQWIIFVSINYFVLKEDPFLILPYRLIWCCIYPALAWVIGIARKRRKKISS